MTVRKKLLIYKVLLFLLAFFIAFLPTTSLRNKEVNSRVIVGILGLDGGDGDKIRLTVQYVMPTEAQGSTGKDTVTVEGETLDEAAETLNTALGRRVELGHCSMVIVGADAKPELLGSLMTATDVTADVWMAAADGKAEDLIVDLTEFMSKTGATDANFIAYGARKAHIATNTLLGFLSDLGSASKTAYIPLVEMQSGKASEGGDSGGSGGGQGGGNGGKSEGGEKASEQKTGMKVEKLAMYGESGRVGIFDSTAARGVAWVSAPVEKGTVCSDVEYDGKTIKGVCGRLLKKHASIVVDEKSGEATIKIKAFIEPHGDKFNTLFATNRKKADDALIAGYTKKIKGEVERAIASSLATNSDPMFIGREFYRYYPDYYKSQYDYYSVKIKYDIQIALK
ncbi:MAG: Ger(x)C family spore germination C-terminal domain-containing protein [Clostridiales bacterium]|nr:Ger(x)C family spore germination C-terminal domain-containing protein [Clostridiales bacterium]